MRHGWLALVVMLWAGALARDAADRWIDATALPVLVHETGAEIRDRHGALLRAYTVGNGLWRLPVSLDQVDPRFVAMLVAYEDRRFYQHRGVDGLALLRAGFQALRNGRIVSGASTLTMQVARLLEDGPTGEWRGKARQVRVALALERHLTKDQILQIYLLLAPYGGNVEGLRAASLVWLGKEPRRLTPAEAALLVALPQAPASRRPDRNAQAARAARDRVLARMVRAGVLDAETARASRRDPSPTARHAMPQLAPHLADRARAAGPGRQDLTLDAGLQARIETLVRAHMAGRDARLSAAVIVADHASGAVLAHVGAPDYGDTGAQGFVDMTQALRSPGSTLKPLVYGLAFDRGLAHPQTLILDAPVQYGRYAPRNFDGVFRGELPVREALQLSLNIPVVRLTAAMGPAHVMAGMRDAGVSPSLRGDVPGLAIALGGLGVTLQDMVQLYAAFARGGEAVPLHWRSQDRTPVRRVLSPASSWHLGNILSQLPPPPGVGRPGQVAYKTGTSYGHRDAWALGWDGQHVAGVWIGRPDGTPVPGAFGGDLAAPLLFQALGRARQRDVPLPPPPPETVMVSHALLPPHLQRFGAPETRPSLRVLFPPDGARLLPDGDGVPLKLGGGVPPFTVLADGKVLTTSLKRPEFIAPIFGPGFATLSVIDAQGNSGRVSIELRR